MNPSTAEPPTLALSARSRAAFAFLWRHNWLPALAAFAIIGLAVFDDYGVAFDEHQQRGVGVRALDSVLGQGGETDHHTRFYGVAFEIPLIIAERALGLEDSRDIYLARHLLTHLFFVLAGGLSAWLLARRMFGDAPLPALFAALLFLSHPRIYAHSFYNTKDPIFLAVFMVALYAIHRAFARESPARFALCGAAVGLLINIRVLGAIPLAAVLGLLALDFARAALSRNRCARRSASLRAAANAVAFSLAAALTLYATWSFLWGKSPLALLESFGVLADLPIHVNALFWGDIYPNTDLPPHFIPVWIAITTPPMTLILAALGIGAALWTGARRPLESLANSETRFRLLLTACLILPLIALAVLRPNTYDDWRQFHFLYAPICLLAVCGLVSAASWTCFYLQKVGLCARFAPRIIYSVAALGLAIAAFETVSIHPYQGVYFNRLVDRQTPEHLRTQWDMAYWGMENQEGIAFLLDAYPDAKLSVRTHFPPIFVARDILSPRDRDRLEDGGDAADFYITNHREYFLTGNLYIEPFAPALHQTRIYGNAIMSVLAINLDWAGEGAADAYRQIYRDVASGDPIASADYDVYLRQDALFFLKDDCQPQDLGGAFLASASPIDSSEILTIDKDVGFDYFYFEFPLYGVRFDGKCMVRYPLPDYPIRALEFGRLIEDDDAASWRDAIFIPPGDETMAKWRREYAQASAGEPAVRSRFDVYLDGGALLYLKQPCAERDLRGRFLVTVFPDDPNDLPEGLRELGRQSLNFTFPMFGALFDGKCMARRELPRYPVREISLGQWDGEGGIWSASVVSSPNADGALTDALSEAQRAAKAGELGEPIIRAEFDVYTHGGAPLIIMPEPPAGCGALQPITLGIFPADGRSRQTLAFDFSEHGARMDGGACLIRVRPPYPIWAIDAGRTNEAGEDAEQPAAAILDDAVEGEPRIRSHFNIHADGSALIYAKRPCTPDDARGRFLVSVFPANPEDLPAEFREQSLEHESRNFTFANHGVLADGACMARIALPDYPIKRVELGQWLPGGGPLWREVLEF